MALRLEQIKELGNVDCSVYLDGAVFDRNGTINLKVLN